MNNVDGRILELSTTPNNYWLNLRQNFAEIGFMKQEH
jgi:hypothetical protein